MNTIPHAGPRIRCNTAGLLPGLFVWLLCCAPVSWAAWGEQDWLQGRMPNPGEAFQNKDAEALAKAALSGNASTLLVAARTLDRSASTTWVRREALLLLLQHFCITEQADSLTQRRAQLQARHGTSFSCAGSDPAPARAQAQAVTPGRWYLQLGAFSTKANAQKALETLRKQGIETRVVKEGKLHRALAGAWATEAEARRMAQEWRTKRWVGECTVRESP